MTWGLITFSNQLGTMPAGGIRSVWFLCRLTLSAANQPWVQPCADPGDAVGPTRKAIALLHSCQNSHSKCKMALGQDADWICAFARTMASFSFITHWLNYLQFQSIPPSKLQRNSQVSWGTGIGFINMKTFCKHCISIPLCRLLECKNYRQCACCWGRAGCMRVLLYFKSNNTGACSRADK